MLRQYLKVFILIISAFSFYKLITFSFQSNYKRSRFESISNYTTGDSIYYRINPKYNICGRTAEKNITLLSLVMVRVDSFEHRALMRSTWASKLMFPRMQVVFVLGYSKNLTLNKLVEKESIIYGDIVQGDFLDTYR